jgi:hypothetical protein
MKKRPRRRRQRGWPNLSILEFRQALRELAAWKTKEADHGHEAKIAEAQSSAARGA